MYLLAREPAVILDSANATASALALLPATRFGAGVVVDDAEAVGTLMVGPPLGVPLPEVVDVLRPRKEGVMGRASRTEDRFEATDDGRE